ncbi:hypothetical protein ABID82_001347 [Methylobacterium sp. PvP062]|uniref:Uncharacterized protein n=3 Tax=Methylobacterium TaxID=407 RepID=A0ABV1R6N7_9HYPH|nr:MULTISPECIES: hypothetical protein [Methylobacterium]MBE7196230.1 hypothetical protein [Parafilimonas terrae]MCX7334573.1 hypothetical protein [Hyphomicrobiales bacterium]MBP2498142.1 hypothetical protein [Methylobacterium sp. PvP105]MBP2501987.1 hypothetical protein [Methylobacterium sp. PvP109]MDE3749018.1 hypothetical protein [Methylobacterium radiotolerans]
MGLLRFLHCVSMPPHTLPRNIKTRMRERVETYHMAFGTTVADILRKTQLSLGILKRVIGLDDSLSVGPIDTPAPGIRPAWGRSILGAKSFHPGELDGEPDRLPSGTGTRRPRYGAREIGRVRRLDPDAALHAATPGDRQARARRDRFGRRNSFRWNSKSSIRGERPSVPSAGSKERAWCCSRHAADCSI